MKRLLIAALLLASSGTLGWPSASKTILPDGGAAPKRTGTDPQPNGVGSVAFSPDGSKLAWGLPFGGTRLRDLENDQEITLRERGYLAFSPDGQTLAIVDDWNSGTIIRLWDAETGQQKATLKGPPDQWNSAAAFSPDGPLASGSYDGTILLWDMPPFITDPSEITAVTSVERAVPAASGLDAIAPNPFNTAT